MNRLIGMIRRPWSKPTLVLVTALIAGAAGYAVATTRPGEEPLVAEPSMAVESWLGELERDPVTDVLGEPAEEALDAAPPGVEVVEKIIVAQNPYTMGGSGLLALPAGEWALYASCRVEDGPDAPESLSAGLNVLGGGSDRYLELSCPADGSRVLAVLEPDEDTVYTFSLMPDMGDDSGEEVWELMIAAGVFIAAA